MNSYSASIAVAWLLEPATIAFMKEQSIVYLICGFIGAGKTTFAKKLEKETGAVRITKDEWSIRLIGNDPTIDGYAEWDQKIIGLSRDFAFHLAEKGIDVIMDEGFWGKEEREELKRRIQAIGAKAVMYYVDTPIETMRERVAGRNNNLTRASFKISREMLENYLIHWQPPGKDEDYILASEVK
jgi:predicted kinase